MTLAAYMTELRRLGVELKVDRDKLVCNAPKGVLTPEMQVELTSRKAELITFLQSASTVPANDTHTFDDEKREGYAPLSFAQERLWYLDQLEPGTATYNIPSAIKIRGALELDILKRSLNEIVCRYEILRTRFTIKNDTPVQIVEPSVALDLPLVDFSHLPDGMRETELTQYLQSEANHPFDLAKAPLLRTVCIRICETEHVLFFMAHHTIFDGSSLGIMLSEIATLYNAFLAGKPSPLAQLPSQYADYAIWQRCQLNESELQRLLEYWRERLSGDLPTLQMPTDRPRPPRQTYRGSVETIQFPGTLVDNLTEIGRQDGATLFMVMLAAFNVLLHRYTGQDDFIVGAPMNGRNRPEFERAIGFYVNTLALRTDVSGDPTFRELLRRVRQGCLGAYSHQELPFEKLVQEFEAKRDLSRTPLFQALFAFQDIANRSFESGGLAWTTQRVDSQVARTDLSFWLTQTDAGISAAMEYSSDLFDKRTIARLLEHYKRLLEGLRDNQDDPISALPLLSEGEQDTMTVEWNTTQSDYPHDCRMHHLFEAQAERTPNATAAIFGDETITFDELNRRANQLSHHLRSLGVGSETLVGICLNRSLEMMVGLLGILKAGGAYVPLDPDFPLERLAYMVADADLQVLVTAESLVARLPERAATLVRIDSDAPLITQQCDRNPAIEGRPGDLAYVIYTSGSTGKPKGVQVPHKGVVNFLCSMREKPGMTESDRLLAVTTLSFDIAVLELFLPLAVGATVVIASRDVASDGRKILDTLSAARITVMQATPATWQMMISAGWDATQPITVLCGGEPMLPDLADELVARGNAVWNLYGPTETTIWSTCFELTESGGPILIGRPIANTQVYVLDDQWRPVPVGVAGELYIGGDGVTRGYLNQPALTAERFLRDEWTDGNNRLYRTGDLARWQADGCLEHLGRIDSQVKIRGFRIELGEIESVLSEHSSIEQVAVNVWNASSGDQRLVAYLVLRHGERLDTIMLRKHLSNKLPGYMLPQHYVELDAIPLTPNGKVDRKQLPAPTGMVSGDAKLPPVTGIEKVVAGVWSRLLGIDEIGRHDNFFDIGGHSLLAVKAVLELEKATGARIMLRHILLEDLFQIANHIQAMTPQNRSEQNNSRGGFFRRLVHWTRRA